METINKTPFKFAPIPGRLNFPKHSLTLIVKGTFDLSNGSETAPCEQQLHPTGDEFYPDDVDMEGSPRYESDFAYSKPRADLLLAGSCHPPGGKPVQACQVKFQVGSRSRTLHVFGDRKWKGPLGFPIISDPEPFTQKEIRYENSFGGKGYHRNPVGQGYSKEETEEGKKVSPLPNIEDPENRIDSPQSKPEPAGFGPLGRMWEQRFSRLGTYKGKWLKKRWPWFPEDFDYGHFNAAPQDMQVEGYLRGDEKLYFENLHPQYSKYESRLPGLRVRCFLNKLIVPETDETRFYEVSMRLDTLWVDMDAEKIVLVWRGVTEIQSEEFEEMQHVFIMSEPLEKQAESLENYYQLFLATLAQIEKEWAAAPEKTEEAAEEPETKEAEQIETDAVASIEPPISKDALKKSVGVQVSALLAQAGIDIKGLPPEVREKAQQEQDRLINKLTETDPDKIMAMEREELESQMADALAKVDIDPENLPPVSEKARQEQMKFMQELGLEDVDAAFQDPDMAKFCTIMAAVLPKAGIDPENLTPLIVEAKKQQARLRQTQVPAEEEADKKADEKDKAPSPLTREMVKERVARGDSFAGENLSGLDLSGLDMKGLDFGGAIFAGTVVSNANLTKADLSKANLAGADLSEARLKKALLKDADLTGAKLIDADLTGALLNDAVFVRTKMAGAILKGVEAADTYFVEADLSGAKLSNSDLSGADFSKSMLNEADFQGAKLKEASVEGAVGIKVNFAETDLTELRASEGCDFSKGLFVKAVGFESIWEKANLSDADFSFSRMQGANFTNASLERANLYASDMKSSRFRKASLKGAKLVRMNLFEGSLEKADLTAADLSGSNMYCVEFLDAVIERTRMDRTNLKMTKLDGLVKSL